MHRAKGDRLVRASVLPVCDNAHYVYAMRESKKFCQRGSNSNVFFLVGEGRVDPKYHLK